MHMKTFARRGMALLLSVLLLCSLSVGALAADEIGITATLNTATLTESDTAQTVTLTVAPQSSVSVCGVGLRVVLPEGWSFASITNDDANMPVTAGDINLDEGLLGWLSNDMEDYSISKFAIFTINVPAGTAAGSYEIKVDKVDVSKNYSSVAVMTEATTASATLTIAEGTVTPPEPVIPEGYTVSVGDGANINIGADAAVALNVTHKDGNAYNAYYFEVSYDTAVLTYKSVSDGAAVDSSTEGVLKIAGYGADKESGTAAATVTFTGKAAGTGNVTVTKANVDASAMANAQNAPAANISETAASAAIVVGGYSVTLPEGFTGAAGAAAGEDYTFTGGADCGCYDVTATMGGETAAVETDGSGSYTIKNVSGEIVVTATPKSYTASVTGSGAAQVTLPEAAPTYKTDYAFTLTEKSGGYTYSVTVTVGGTAYTGYTVSEGTYTVPGADVKGDIVIDVTETAPAPTTTSITVEGVTAEEVEGGSLTLTAPNGADFTFKLVKQDGFTYTTKLGEDELAVAEDGSITVPAAKLTGAALTVTVTKTSQNPYEVEVYEYVKLSEAESVWLVVAKSESTLVYGTDVMFTSEKYGGYCWLVISGSDADTVKAAAVAAVKTGEGTSTAVVYTGDVNGTTVIDVNDAQLVYNIYNAVYGSFESTGRAMFLAADVNGDKTVNVTDAAAVVNTILGK